jgi:hypothetical protein
VLSEPRRDTLRPKISVVIAYVNGAAHFELIGHMLGPGDSQSRVEWLIITLVT